MSWEWRSVEEQRAAFVIAAQNCNNFSAVCRTFGITRKTGYKWMERYKAGEPMNDQSRAPHSIANKTPVEMEERILRVRIENPGWGAKTIRRVLENEGQKALPCVKTINNILHRYGCIDPEESAKREPFVRYAKEHCNDMWQADFKGEFLMNNGRYCFPLDIIDDCSRFAIMIKPAETTANVVIPGFTAAFQEYGLPKAVLSDNGAQFAGYKQGYTQFEKWLMNLDVLPIHGRIKHPQTQGKIERFHRSMKSELLKYHSFDNLNEANDALQKWKTKYNTIRPHEALHMLCPADVYVPSNRKFPDKIEDYTYSGQYHVIKVNSWGYIRFAHFQVYLSQTMIGEYVEFRPSEDDKTFSICYRNFKIAEYDAATGVRLNRRISRL